MIASSSINIVTSPSPRIGLSSFWKQLLWESSIISFRSLIEEEIPDIYNYQPFIFILQLTLVMSTFPSSLKRIEG